ncbi:hypothetical protein, partial [Pararhodobacter oceanensis]|uniref:hypothetical protein n=1 Tax=Pararhodobacter oceanensis TaxID=2172121 RepID=UPI003A8CAA68
MLQIWIDPEGIQGVVIGRIDGERAGRKGSGCAQALGTVRAKHTPYGAAGDVAVVWGARAVAVVWAARAVAVTQAVAGGLKARPWQWCGW